MKITAFANRVAPDVKGAPQELIRQAVVDAADKFCTDSRAWSEVQDAVLLIDGEGQYELELPNGARALSVKNIWCGSRKLDPVTIDQLSVVLPDWQTAVSSLPSWYCGEFVRKTFRLFPTPAQPTTAIRIQGIFAPSESSESLPDFLWEDYRSIICAGAKATLMLKQGMAWFNPQLASVNAGIFELGINDAKVIALHGNQTGTLTVAPRRFG